MRKGFNFYNSYWEQIKLLDDKQKLQVFNAICEVQFLEKNIDDIIFKDKMLILVWTGIKHSIETSLNGYLSKQKALNKDIVTPLAKGLNMGGAQQVQEEEKEQVQLVEKKKNEYDDFLEQLSKACKYKTKVTKTKDGIKLFKSILNKEKLFVDYIQHQLDKDNFAVRITDFMKDYGTVHDIKEVETYGF